MARLLSQNLELRSFIFIICHPPLAVHRSLLIASDCSQIGDIWIRLLIFIQLLFTTAEGRVYLTRILYILFCSVISLQSVSVPSLTLHAHF
jgi:hypothetical protein